MAHKSRRHPPQEGLGYLIVFLLAVIFIISFWQIILACIIGAFLLYLLWHFRENVCQGIATVFNGIFRFISRSYNRLADSYNHRQNHHRIPRNENSSSDDDLPMIKRR